MNEYFTTIASGALTLPRPAGTSGPRVNRPSPKSLATCRRAPLDAIRLAGFCLLLALVPARAAAPADDGWQLLSRYLFRDAYEAFTKTPPGSDRERALGAAASLLNHPPVTPGKVAEAETALRQLTEGGATDETALYARYLLARIAQVHRTGEVTEIEADYRALIAAAPAHPIAQVAAGKLALVLLYQRPDLSVPERLAAAAALEPVAVATQLPEASFAYYRALSGAALYYTVLNPQVLHWMLRADEIGTVDLMAASSLRIQIAETARALGRRDLALEYYRRFLEQILPTDGRYRTAKERMAELEAQS